VKLIVALLIAGMILFAVFSAAREIKAYRKYLGGEKEYLVSKKRRNRRILIAAVLIAEAILLFLGIFALEFQTPMQMLIYWIVPTLLILWLVYLGMQDFRETSHDLDVIVRETSDVILKKGINGDQ
jgi:hypothetical protein